MARRRNCSIGLGGLTLVLILTLSSLVSSRRAQAQLLQVDPLMHQGICVVLGLPDAGHPESVVELAADKQLKVYFQSSDPAQLDAVRRCAAERGLLGTQVFAEQGAPTSLHVATNLADLVLVSAAAEPDVPETEILRVLRPQGKAIIGSKELVKPTPEGVDDWSHVYHGPDNNPQSTDQIVALPIALSSWVAHCSRPCPK